MRNFRAFLARKNIVVSAHRYGIDALGYMAHGLFCSLLIGTILKTLGQQISWQFLVDVGQYAFEMAGPAMGRRGGALVFSSGDCLSPVGLRRRRRV